MDLEHMRTRPPTDAGLHDVQAVVYDSGPGTLSDLIVNPPTVSHEARKSKRPGKHNRNQVRAVVTEESRSQGAAGVAQSANRDKYLEARRGKEPQFIGSSHAVASREEMKVPGEVEGETGHVTRGDEEVRSNIFQRTWM